MDKSPSSLGACVLLACGALLLTSCSMIGHGLGNAMAPEELGETVVVPDQLTDLKRGTDIIVLKKDSTIVKGTLDKIDKIQACISPERYREDYEQWRINGGRNTTSMPTFGSSVRVRVRTLQGSDLYAGRFLGFDTGILRILQGARGRFTPLRLPTILDMSDSLEQVITRGESIIQALQEGAPLASRQESKPGLVLKGDDTSLVGLDEIQAVHLWEGRNARWTGFGIGLALDVAAIILGVMVGGKY